MDFLARLTRSLVVTPKAAAAVATALLILSVIVGVFTDRASRREQAQEAQVQAEILAGSLAGALAFDDRETAKEYLNALAANPAVEAAAAYDAQGRLAASLHRAGDPPPAVNMISGPIFTDGKLRVSSRVQEGTTRLGSVYLRLSTDTLLARLARYTAVGAIIIMSSLLIVVLGSSHARLREAHQKLQQETAEREKAEDALRQSQKMEAMGQLTGGVAHDFNNLLMVASSSLDLMDRTSDPARRERLKAGIRQAIDRGASLTQQLLAFARRAPVKPEVLSPDVALRGMLNLLERSLREDVTVDLQLPPDLWPIEVDPSAFELATLNVAINARDAMPTGGVIRIHAENVPADAGRADHVRICVTDTGVGLAPELVSRVFEPFFTTKGVARGTGLGLSQVYGFARSSGGDVEFTSELGAGTTVCLRIPRSAKPLPDSKAPTGNVERGDHRRCRILLVEDDDSVAQFVQEMLEELGYEVVRASQADAALERLSADPRLDLVFSDMVMPGAMDGLALAEAISARRPELPIVLTTGYSSAAASAAAKGVRLLLKPYRIDLLQRELAAALAAKQRSA